MSDEERPVERCVCCDITFERMLLEGCKSVDEAANRWGCTTKCGLCKPYIERTLETGEVRHRILGAS